MDVTTDRAILSSSAVLSSAANRFRRSNGEAARGTVPAMPGVLVDVDVIYDG